MEVTRALDDDAAPALSEEERGMAIAQLEDAMLAAANNLDFEKAAKLRDQMLALKGEKVMAPATERSRKQRRRRERV